MPQILNLMAHQPKILQPTPGILQTKQLLKRFRQIPQEKIQEHIPVRLFPLITKQSPLKAIPVTQLRLKNIRL